MNAVLAQSGISFLIYLIAGIVWLVSNVLQQKKVRENAEKMKRRRLEEEEAAREGREPEPDRKDSVESELEAFLERLAGLPPRPEPPPAPPVAAVPAPAPPPVKPVPPPPPVTANRVQPPAGIQDLDMEASFKQIEELKEVEDIIVDLPEGQQLKLEAMRGVRSMQIDLSNTTLRMPTLRMQSIRPVPTQTRHPDIRNPKTFRRALISSMLLEPPKALQPRPFEGTP